MPHWHYFLLLQEHFLCGETVNETLKEMVAVNASMYYSVNLLLFPFRAGVDDRNTTGTGNIGFNAYFYRQWNSNSQLCYQYELPCWFLDAINVNLEELPCMFYLCVLLYALSILQIGKSQCLLLKHLKWHVSGHFKNLLIEWKTLLSHRFVSASKKTSCFKQNVCLAWQYLTFIKMSHLWCRDFKF